MSERRYYNPIDNEVEYKLQQLIFEALGYASVCWDPKPTGVFESDDAKRVAEKLIEDIIDLIRKQ